ncbi:MAG: 3'(2'),5'-bisphosphate nucleotidase [Planctomycetota bacterium]
MSKELASQADLAAAIPIVARCCVIARRVQTELDHIREVTKDDRSPVTVADFAVQAYIGRHLPAALGDIEIVGEEQSDMLRDEAHATVLQEICEAINPDGAPEDPNAVLDAIDACDHDATGARYWALDPIDGTKGFLRGQQYAIALGLIENGEVIAGVMGCPNLPGTHDAPLDGAAHGGTIFAAIRGAGAWQLPVDGNLDAAHRINASDSASASAYRLCESVEAGHSKKSDRQRVVDHVGGNVTPIRLDSQAKYSVVARGQSDAYLRLPTSATYREKIWDHAAGMRIALEAGARVTDISGAPLDFTAGRQLDRNRGIVCASVGLHDRLIEAIDALGIGATV